MESRDLKKHLHAGDHGCIIELRSRVLGLYLHVHRYGFVVYWSHMVEARQCPPTANNTAWGIYPVYKVFFSLKRKKILTHGARYMSPEDIFLNEQVLCSSVTETGQERGTERTVFAVDDISVCQMKAPVSMNDRGDSIAP
jgi:hypothetical protein